MVGKTSILANLRHLDARYRSATSVKAAEFASKLAIIELCGWIEESMDDVISRCAIRTLKKADNRIYCEKEIIKRTYGFDYDLNFRRMLIRLLGLVGVERIERQVDPGKHAVMKAALSDLKVVRNAEAHTHVRGTTPRLNAPSVTIQQFQPVYDGLIDVDRVIRLHW